MSGWVAQTGFSAPKLQLQHPPEVPGAGATAAGDLT